ncbi:hypothetical protein PC116_g31683 [Phytophthora cactorum]|nr:hypothetical protein PC116_g31683 [Phytophthora cactorum]
MLLPRIFGELSGSITNDPRVNPELSGIEADGTDVGLDELEIFVGVGRLNGITASRIAKHTIAGHLYVDGVFLTISEGVWEDPLDTFTSSG